MNPMRSAGRRTAALVALALGFLTLASCGSDPSAKRVLVLGFDGMDPVLLQKLMDRGEMPNFKRLAAEGAFLPLGTVTPPQSPVAWATMVTGLSPGGTGIFDFIHRDPITLLPHLSTAQVEEPERILSVGDWRIPLESGGVQQLMHGETFWQILDRHGIPATVLKMPSNFPPVESESKTLSGMGTPDVRGTYGIFHHYTDDGSQKSGDIPGGQVHVVEVIGGKAETELPGPVNTMHVDQPTSTVPLTIYVDAQESIARVDIADEQILLQQGEWSDWVRVEFELIPYLASVHGIVRFQLAEVHPHLKLYASPVNMDPLEPALPISTPESFSKEIASHMGLFYTQGMPEDTKALSAGVLDDASFMKQAAIILDEEDAMLSFALDRFESGLLFVYYSAVDQVSHAMWRSMDEDHPLWNEELGHAHGEAIENVYRHVDASLGMALDRVPSDTAVLVLSDHGFAPFYREVNLNTWLKDEGFLSLTDESLESETELFNHVDWSRTRAYAMGLNGLYINRIGRESKGAVLPGKATDALLQELEEKLLALRDPDSGEKVVGRVYRATEEYDGPFVHEAPDLIVGYRRGFRTADDSALGTLSRPVVRDRTDPWSGDHLMETEAVPGVLLSNAKIPSGQYGLEDLAPTILSLYGIAPKPEMVGSPIPLPGYGETSTR